MSYKVDDGVTRNTMILMIEMACFAHFLLLYGWPFFIYCAVEFSWALLSN